MLWKSAGSFSKLTNMKKIKTYKGFIIWKNGFNYSVEMPCGSFFSDDAANIKTAEKWIDAEIFRRNN